LVYSPLQQASTQLRLQQTGDETMTGSLSYLLDAGWLFFAGWSLVVVTVSVIAFGKDFVSVPPLLFEKRAFEKQRSRNSGKAL
jgi:hypothetical protein